ncbi:hypothetical protein [Pelagibius litoralis]|uniref:terminase small subunit-like protein n=1 Tax=Pelagibius litoralis TaxID=374515 RepID=UPI00346032FD
MTGQHPPYDATCAARLFSGMDADKAVRHICEEEGMPSMKTLKHWRKTNREFREGYAAAMERKRERVNRTDLNG